MKEGTTAGDLSTSDIKFANHTANYSSTYNFVVALGDNCKLGQVDMYGTGGYTNIRTEDFDDITLQLDGNSKYYLCFRAAGVNENFTASSGTYFYACAESFKLTSVEEPVDELTSFSISSSSESISAELSRTLEIYRLRSSSSLSTRT